MKNLKTFPLINYILSKQGKVDVLKMNKLLYFIDFENYYLFEKSITDLDYYHLQHGPVPNHNYSKIYTNAENEGYLDFTSKNDMIFKEIAISYDKFFLPNEIETIDLMLGKYGGFNGKELEALSHQDEPWLLTEMNEKINFELVNYRNSKIVDFEDITEIVMNA